MREWQKETKKCKECGEEFVTKNYNQVFCSNECRIDRKNNHTARAVEHYRTCPLAKEEQ